MKEIQYQTKIIKDLENSGGFGKKWSSAFQVGPPDLVLSHHQIGGAWFMEVKKLEYKERVTTFNRQINLTALQRKCLRDLFNAGARVCVGVVVEYGGRGDWDLVIVDHNTRILKKAEPDVFISDSPGFELGLHAKYQKDQQSVLTLLKRFKQYVGHENG